jgi:large subunit ribosomal protein L30e
MDINRSLKVAATTGKVLIGTKETAEAIKGKKAKLIVLASNTPEDWKTKIETEAKSHHIPVYNFTGTSVELGTVCGKPFSVAALSILEAGESDVLQLARAR